VGLAEGCELQRSGAWSLRLDSLIAVASDTKLYATQTIGLGLIALDSPNLAGPHPVLVLGVFFRGLRVVIGI
jgi:hypothetical protein